MTAIFTFKNLVDLVSLGRMRLVSPPYETGIFFNAGDFHDVK